MDSTPLLAPGRAAADASSSVEKALDLLEALHTAGEPLGPSALARALGLPKSTVHRLLATLVSRGLVERAPRGGYRPGFALVALGLGVLRSDPLVAAARPALEAEARALGETVFLTAARGGRIAVLEKAEGAGFLRAAPQVGSTVPVHATAVGKLFLAFAPDEVALAEPLAAYTPATRTSPEALAREVARARAEGFAVNRDEWIPGLAVVAAPVHVGGRLLGALAVAAPTARVDDLGAGALAARLVAAANAVAARLEGRAPAGAATASDMEDPR
ncbi:MAG TPA: IclR family transcriptional regulator [Myxococcota bacterium]|jgi:DNA-binding IclR family transcriptional regulator|nr:IclR family transcriptional regulator [Myxococcota bacterium]